jgi:predicted nucleotide-binding protein (sugar kinase/HSP70/actin superfamily)
MREEKPLYPTPNSNGHTRKIFIPWMGDMSYALAATFRSCGLESEVLPVGGQETIELGRRFTSGKECLPCIITAGDMIRVVKQPDFDRDRTAFFMPGGSGPCRFGQYHCVHKLLLNDLGVPDVPVLSLSQDSEFYEECKQFGQETLLRAWNGACASDVLLKALLALRPYETERGATDRVYERWIHRICERIEKQATADGLAEGLAEAQREFAAVPVDRSRLRPKIGIVGEIYVRFHTAANNDLIRQLEKFGAETTLAGFPEWMYYTNYLRRHQAWDERTFRTWLTSIVEDRVMWKVHRKLHAPFESILGPFAEASIDEVLRLAEPYIHATFQGEAILSVGKMIEMAHHGCHGVVNVGPFSCMPSTIVAGVMKKVTDALGAVPSLTVSYDGQQDPTLDTRLEAFLHQARTYQAGQGDGNGHRH